MNLKAAMRCVRLTFPTGWGAFPCSQINFQNFLINLSAARAPQSPNNFKWQFLNTFKVQVLLITPELCLSDLSASGNKAQHSIQAGLNQASKPFLKHVLKPLQCCEQTDLVWTIKHYFTLNLRRVGITFAMGATLLLGKQSAVRNKTWQWKSASKHQSRNEATWSAVADAYRWFSVSPRPVLPWECPTGSAHKLLTIGILSGLDAHVGLPLLHARLPLPALLLQRRLGAALGVDVGQVGRGVVVSLHGLVVLDLKGDQHGLIAPLGDPHLATTAPCVTHSAVCTDKAESESSGWDINDQILSVLLFYKLQLLL